jgi:MFS family permease
VDSWLLTDLIGDTASRAVAFILFLAAALGFVGASLALFGWLVPHDWWRALALISAVISLVALGLFWNAFVMFFPNKIGSIAVNVAVLAGLLWANWPAEVDIAAR